MAGLQTTAVAGLSLHVPLATSQYRLPRQKSFEGWSAQSACLLQVHVDWEPTHSPSLQADAAVHAEPSSQISPSTVNFMAHSPVLGLQMAVRQAPLSTEGQFTIEAGFGRHFPLVRLQYKVPLQTSPSSNTAQSPSALQSQTSPLAPVVHTPSLQLSLVQPRPSASHVWPSAAGWPPHLPVLESQAVTVQGPSAKSPHVTTVPGFTWQVYDPLSQ